MKPVYETPCNLNTRPTLLGVQQPIMKHCLLTNHFSVFLYEKKKKSLLNELQVYIHLM